MWDWNPPMLVGSCLQNRGRRACIAQQGYKLVTHAIGMAGARVINEGGATHRTCARIGGKVQMDIDTCPHAIKVTDERYSNKRGWTGWQPAHQFERSNGVVYCYFGNTRYRIGQKNMVFTLAIKSYGQPNPHEALRQAGFGLTISLGPANPTADAFPKNATCAFFGRT